jgi:hypothetical protein
MNQEINTTQEVKVQSVYIPENWKKNQEQKGLGYLNWMAHTIQSLHYTDDQKVSDAVNKINQL